ncbi:hypothetical protein SPAN111604_06825 [Sphingomonas antarctica]|uniref:hypothetical protein n=1 Tax=Sphingomonas antarctica TaxID=2040274 RepID=UPI0039EA7401
MVRAATGHKYWSKFTDDMQASITKKSESIHLSLFAPEVKTPIKTIDLPLGGSSSVTDALDLLMSLSEMVDPEKRPIEKYVDDTDGSQTLKLLTNLEKVTASLIGNQSKSLGLHPFVYFYTSKGRHYPPLMMGMFSLVADKIRSNDREWFKVFATPTRRLIEETLIEHKTIITLLISALGSRARIEGGRTMINLIIDSAKSGTAITPDAIAGALKLESRPYSIQSKPGAEFSDDAKSSAFLRDALRQALRCPLCEGYLVVLA